MNLALQSFDTANETGVFLLGIGETSRNFVLVTGVVVALSCVGIMTRLLLVALLPAVLMALVDWQLEQFLPASFLRLVLGGIAWAVCTSLAGWMLCPDMMRAAFLKLRNLLFKRNL